MNEPPEPPLYSEQDVLAKIIIPHLTALGYAESPSATNGVTLRFNHPIAVQQGREKKTIFADLVVSVNDVPVIVVDAKNPRSYLTENDREQVVSYARLLPDIAPYAALCNGSWQIFDSVRKRQIPKLPPCRDLLRDLQSRRLTTSQRVSLVSQATRTLFAIESARDLSRMMRRCHDVIRNLKGYDPTRAFDELSKILFAKMYEEREIAEGRRESNRFTLDSVRTMRRQGVEIIQTLWRDTVASERYREVFSDADQERTIDLPPEAIDRIVPILEDRSLGLTDLDVKGVAFEEFLSATYRGGGLGQYFTPREVVSFMVDLVDPAIGESTIDPSCGTGGFLIRVYDVVSEKIRASDLSDREKAARLQELANRSLVGIDWESRAASTCKMNMIIHGDGHAGVYQANALDVAEVRAKVEQRQRFYPQAPAIEEGTFDIVLTNPPFGARDDTADMLRPYELGRGTRGQKREVLLLERQIRLLRPGGTLSVVIPEGILSNKSDRRIRDFIRRECIVKAVIRLPQDAFRMSGGAACTDVLHAIKKDPANPELTEQGDIFFARAQYVGSSPAGKPIPQNDLLRILEDYRRFERGEWDGIEIVPIAGDDLATVRGATDETGKLWVEPSVNRTSLLYDRLSYVVRSPRITDRFGYTYSHPRYYDTMHTLRAMSAQLTPLEALCIDGYPVRGQKPAEESDEGIPVIKVRNVTGRGIDFETEYAPDTEAVRTKAARALLQRGDILITSTGEGTIGRVDVYPIDEPAIADNHVAICRLQPGIDIQYVAEFLRSEYGQIQMLRYVSGSTGQTELLLDHVRALVVPVPDPQIQDDVVRRMEQARYEERDLWDKARALCEQGVYALVRARSDMREALMAEGQDSE